ncbi:sensor histidine kinase [Paenibacillus cymbidii]|uniref:sensor histidine kinase n=1 Tax=Paenibacillus cymbidii TaxID=1639034 RepID=UPI00108104C5|nr:ATP-binding protein [Paenibacillus cymbidii]
MIKRAAVVLFAVAFLACHVWLLQVTLRYPLVNITVSPSADQRWLVDGIDPDADQIPVPIHIGDEIVLVNGNPPAFFPSVIRWHTLDQAKTLTVMRDGASFELKFGLEKFSPYFYLPFIGGTLGYFLAAVLFVKIRHSPAARQLAFLFFVFGFIFISLGASTRGDPLGKILVAVGTISTPFLFLRFIIRLAQEKDGLPMNDRLQHNDRLLIAILSVPLLPYFVSNAWSYGYYIFSKIVIIAAFFAGILLNLAMMLRIQYNGRTSRGTYMSNLIRNIWIALFISVAPIAAFDFFPWLITGNTIPSRNFSAWFLLLFPVSVAYQIVSKELYDIGIFLRRAMITTLFSLLPGAVIVAALLPFVPLSYIGLYFLIIVILLSTTLYLMENVFTRVEAVLFPRKHYLQTSLKQVARKLETISSFRDLKDVLLSDIVSILHVSGGALVFVYKDATETIGSGTIDMPEALRLATADSRQESEYFCLPITRNETYASCLVVTRKKNGLPLIFEEKTWLATIVSYLAVCLENIHLVRKLTVRLQQFAAYVPSEAEARELNWFRKLTFELQENERRRIASDLHDTTMQDILFLRNKLAAIFEPMQLDEATKRRVRSVYEYIDIINANLRESFFELFPHLLQEIGLVRTIEQWLAKEAVGAPFEIRFQASGNEAIERYELETKRHIFRVVQELLSNAKKHSRAAHVSLGIAILNGSLSLTYADDGVGFEPQPNPTFKADSTGMGIEFMRSRVHFLQGAIAFDTGQGRGLKVTILIPLREERIA